MTPTTPPSKFPRWMFIPIATALLFLGVWQVLAPAERKAAPVAFSDFMADVRDGRVDEIRIRDHEYEYRLHAADGGSPQTILKVTLGPTPNEALVASLKPDDPNKPLPKIYFEK